MGKLIAKTAAVTIAAVIAAALILFGAVGLISPASLASFTDSLGMDGACAYYTVAAAERTGSAEDLALATERSYLVGHYEDAASCGERLLDDGGFAQYCAAQDAALAGDPSLAGTYEQYITGVVSSSMYFVGRKDAALERAMFCLGGAFPENNAVVYLGEAAVTAGDADFCSSIVARLNEYSLAEEGDASYLQEFIAYLEKVSR